MLSKACGIFGLSLALAALAQGIAVPVNTEELFGKSPVDHLSPTLPKDPALGLVCVNNTGCYWGHICVEGACIKACNVDMDCHHTQRCNHTKGNGKTGKCWWKYNSLHKGQECRAFGDKCWQNKQCCSGTCDKWVGHCKKQRMRLQSDFNSTEPMGDDDSTS
ncbi:hypothetical protein N7495_003948 [Penicillium taxi]|uniref:uncharacterized protein n=1 Tax=Penicillium taxi TaxID=168475 RepID=UPI0025458F01|nr:uncharacterized protein N7495_003948 [Penicillium taxi]KAJ5899204.1 hypothetical protein N7495_003948 [Penicillium taxi]